MASLAVIRGDKAVHLVWGHVSVARSKKPSTRSRRNDPRRKGRSRQAQRPKVPAAVSPKAMSRLPEIKERVALQRRIAELEAERRILFRSRDELKRLIDMLVVKRVELEAEVERLRELFQKLLHEYAGTIEGEWGLDEGPTGSMYQEVERRWSSRLTPEPKP